MVQNGVNIKVIPLEQIRENPVALRSVSQESIEYREIVDSIAEKGLLSAITVRQQKDPETKKMFYEIIDGLQRYSACKELGIKDIAAIIIDADKAGVIERQIIANAVRVETKPAEYSRALKTLLQLDPIMTEAKLAQKLGKSVAWIRERLNLNKITDKKIIELIDSGKIVVSNAYALSKLPPQEQIEFVDKAQSDAPDVFVPLVTNRINEIRKAQREGRDPETLGFKPAQYMQKMKAVKNELEVAQIGPILCKKYQLKTPEAGFAMAIQWVLNFDPESQASQQAEYDARKKKKEEAATRRKEERAKVRESKESEAIENALDVEEATEI